MKNLNKITAACLAAVCCIAYAEPEQQMVITGLSTNQLEIQQISGKLQQVAGGTNLIDLDNLQGSQSSLAKVLNQQIGIVVQEFFGGNDQPRINIRGSGIQDNPVNRGIQILNDGLALNQADGSFIIGLIDPEQANLISVYRGANAMRYGATTLGGAINLHSKTGLNSDSQTLFETGSFGVVKFNHSISGQDNRWDYFANVSHSQRDGYRNHSAAKRLSTSLNIGLTKGNWQNRSYLTITENDFEMPFLLTKEMAISNADKVMGEGETPMDSLLNIPIRKPFRKTTQIRIANKTDWLDSISTTSLGFYLDHNKDEFRNPLTQSNTTSKNIGLDLNSKWDLLNDEMYQRSYQIFLSANIGEMPRDISSVHPATGELMTTFSSMDLKATNIILGAQIDYEIIPDLHMTTSVQWVENKREITDKLNQNVLDSDLKYQIINPKLGLIYNNETTRFYTNLSGSSEAPNFWQIATVSANPTDPLNNHVYINPLQAQTAITSEFGLDNQTGKFNTKISWYYSIVDKELISTVDDFAVNGKTINYQGQSIHQGVEAQIQYQNENLLSQFDEISLQFLYNWSNFYFDDGLYKNKKIAGVPEHLVQGKADYQITTSSAKWFIEPNFTWQPNNTFTDHFNTENNMQDSYVLLGLKLGYSIKNGPEIFFDINNIGNIKYQTAYAIRGQGSAELPTFIPGPGINAILGVKYTW